MRNIIIRKTKRIEKIPQTSEVIARKNFDISSLGTKPLLADWGKVVKSYSKIASVDVEINGIVLPYVPVRSLEWVTQTSQNKATGERDMPPLKSKVLVIFPGGIVDGAFVLCSGFDPLVESQTSELLTEDKDKEYLKINEIGWKKTYNKETGKLNIEGPSTDTNQIKLEVDRENSKIKLELGNYSILLDKTARKLEAIVESHTLKMDQNEQLIENSNGGKIKTDQTGSVIAETSSGTFKIDSSGNITFNNGTESYVLGTSFIAALKIYLNVESGITPGTTAQNAAALTAIQGAAAALLTAMGTNNDYLSQKIKGA